MNFSIILFNNFNTKKLLFGCVICVGLLPCTIFSQNNLPLDLKLIPGGDFGRQVYDSITGVTKTYLTHPIKDFYLSTTEVSVQDFQSFCKATNRSMPPAPAWGWDDPKLPVVNVSYDDALDYCFWLQQQYGVPFRLPEWDEWEYAAREGDFDPVESTEVDSNQVVYANNSNEKPKCITCMQPNKFGIYASMGNVWEWVTKTTFYTTDSLFNIQESRQETFWAGGSFFEDATQTRPGIFMPILPASRRHDAGFRVAVDAMEYQKGQLLQKINTLLYQIFEDQSFMANEQGIFGDEDTFYWYNIPPGVNALSYNQENAEIFFCCTFVVYSQDIEAGTEKETLVGVGFKVPKHNADYVFDLMHLLNEEQGNLELLKKQ